ncbi:type III-B CRISPR-associated protein Cas10/Cmr2 [Alteromonas gilva]|uniref:Type III-B CRISPR-associated protein Cas10/Cmr2 n=1 Tax=Alteromonas gilva TaxID=2987522 RepID=A0ABT5L4U1_9ALTE|nr:type III-B CRISPR-associated protein Cas10/Cmr2 [Alteromonas gilva]MDC8832069.1 type III-B CRISPR-associated protein Cas10/Cmr2 [Alteromonas gilva]
MAEKNKEQCFFHFSIGPVHRFVTQARRTRDYWAGSFLLSWLTAVAMRAVEKQGGTLVLPLLDEQFRHAMANPLEPGPRIARLPNRFSASFEGKAEDRVNEFTQVATTVRQMWLFLCEQVWAHSVSPAFQGDTPVSAQLVWEQQTKSFFDIRWVATPTLAEGHSAMAARSGWRNNTLQTGNTANGLQCALIQGLQELSGYTENGRHSSLKRRAKEEFWQVLRNYRFTDSARPIPLTYDLREGEFLSAIAFIKRRFIYIFDDLLLTADIEERLQNPSSVGSLREYLSGYWNKLARKPIEQDSSTPEPSDYDISGWRIQSRIPSLAYIAASDWLKRVIIKIDSINDNDIRQKLLRDWAELARSFGQMVTDNARKEDKNVLCVLNRTIGTCNHQDVSDVFADIVGLDGTAFYKTELVNKNNYSDLMPEQFNRLSKAPVSNLTNLYSEWLTPSPYYALLAMDGDKFGDYITSNLYSAKSKSDENIEEFNQKLNAFTQKAEAIVESHHGGFLVYVGGEDILALLPAANALACACDLREHFCQTFRQNQNLSVSAAVNFAHFKVPFGKMIRETESMLGDVAKNQAGRDSLAVSLWNQGNCQFQWFSRWDSIPQDAQSELSYVYSRSNCNETDSPRSLIDNNSLRITQLCDQIRELKISRRGLYQAIRRLENSNSITKRPFGISREELLAPNITPHNQKLDANILNSLIENDFARDAEGADRLALKGFAKALIDFSQCRIGVEIVNNDKTKSLTTRICQGYLNPEAIKFLLFVLSDYKEVEA